MALTEELRISILQFALQGKITEQLITDGSVDELLDHIQEKKKAMIASGTMKREKKLPPFDDDVLFDIPQNWRWARMQHFLDVRDGTHDSPKYYAQGVPFVTSKNISKGFLDFTDVNFISQEDADKINQRSLVEENDILLAMIGSIGNPVKVHKDRDFAIKNLALIKSVPDSNINMDYVLILLQYMQEIMKKDSSGGVQKFVSLSYLREFPVPVPPIEEQQRIVERVKMLMGKLDEFSEIEEQLIALKASFPMDMRSAILQAALQGKLSERLAADSSVNEIIVKASQQREMLLNNKAIKKETLLDVDDTPFDIPDSWKFIRMGNTITLLSGQDFTPDKYSDIEMSDGIPYLTGASSIENGNVLINRWTMQGRSIAKRGSLLFTCKGTVGTMAFLDVKNAHIARQIMAINPLGGTNIRYIQYCIENFILTIKGKAKSAIPGVDRSVVLNLVIPLPPIEEQQRIVERLDVLLPLCDTLVE